MENETIKNLKKDKAELCDKIFVLLQEFTQKYGVGIDYININKLERANGDKNIIGVTINVEI